MTIARRALLFAALLGAGIPASAQGADPIVEAARDAGTAGEQADGYLGIRGGTTELAKHVGQINIQRRAVYTDTAAAKTGVTVVDVAAAAGCQLLANRVAPNHYYRTSTGEWRQRSGTATVMLPAYCGR